MIGQSNLNKSQNALQTSMERLSSGLRINSANRMTASITGLAQAQRNANDNLQQEEIDRIARETDFNGTNVLNVTEETNISIQVGAKDGEMIDWNLFNKDGGLGFDVRSAVVAGATAPTADNDVTIDASDLNGITGEVGTALTIICLIRKPILAVMVASLLI